MAKGLHVVHDRRALVKPEHGREVRWLDPRVGAFAFQRFDQTGFLAADVSPGAAVDEDVAGVFGAADVFTDKTCVAGLLDRRFQNARALRKLTADIDVGLLHVVRETGNHGALDQLVGILMNDVAVLEGARLGLVGIDHEVDRLAALAIDERPLEATGKTGATATAQTGLLHVVANVFRL